MARSEETVDDYIAARSGPVREVLTELRALVAGVLPNASEGMKWGAPVFINAAGVPQVYLYGGKDHANLGFVHGAGLDDPDGLLQGKGKTGRHVKCWPGDDLPKRQFTDLLRQCA